MVSTHHGCVHVPVTWSRLMLSLRTWYVYGHAVCSIPVGCMCRVILPPTLCYRYIIFVVCVVIVVSDIDWLPSTPAIKKQNSGRTTDHV
jgi:hypothetical protein